MVGRDIREFFPQTVVQVIQKDAIKRLNLTSLLTEKEMLESGGAGRASGSNIDVLEPGDTEKNKAIASKWCVKWWTS